MEYGTLTHVDGGAGAPARWHLDVAPHVAMRVKHIFPRINVERKGILTLKDTLEVCRDLEWVLERYALKVSPWDKRTLTNRSKQYRQTLETLEIIKRPEYEVKVHELGNGYTLHRYQSVAVDLLLGRGSLLLADDVGLGKTVSAIGAFTNIETLPALVCCQPHLCGQWRDQIEEFLPDCRVHVLKKGKPCTPPPADVYICSYSRVAKWDEILKGVIRMCVFDEIQELRRDESQKYIAAKTIRENAAYCLGMSATPIFNYGGEIWNILEMVCPGILGTRDEFQREWCHSIGNGKYVLNEPAAFGTYLAAESIMLRRTRTMIGRELPPVQTVIQTVPHCEADLAHIDTLATELAKRILDKDATFTQKGEASREFDMKLRQATGIAKAPAVAQFVRMLVESGQPVLLTAWHRECYDIYRKQLAGLRVWMYTGSESVKAKEEAKAAVLAGEVDVLIMSLRSGVGLDGLQGRLRIAVFGELDWSASVHRQVIGRLWRDGMGEWCQAYFLVSDAGSDPTLSRIVGLKSAQLSGIIDPENKNALDNQVQGDDGRVKQLAQDWLNRKRRQKEDEDE